ncbi:MAG: response regulator transcription factor [Lachnospiraceae bacterium]|nr:response regulator transcription factor [Lachnospiraceae bacterium]
MKIKILLADDHSMIREGIKQLLELDPNFTVIGQAGDGLECIRLLQRELPDILLLDVNMPKMNGIDVLQKIKEKKWKLKVLMLTIHNEVDYLLKAVDIGCNGYVLKDSNIGLLKKAIMSIYREEVDVFIQPDLIPMYNMGLINREENSQTLDGLTKREIEVLKLITEGLFNKEIAYKLNISERTVKNHVSNIFKKINASDRTQAAVFAIRNGLVDVK